MALRPMGLANAAGNFVNSYMMGRQVQAERAEQSKQNEIKTLMGGMIMGQSTPEQQEQFSQLAPQQFVNTQNYLQQQQAKQSAGQDVMDQESDVRDLTYLMSTTDDAAQTEYLTNRVAKISELGGDPKDTVMLLNMPPEQRNKAIQMLAAQNNIAAPKSESKTDFTKDLLASGIKAGSEEFKSAVLEKYGKGNTIGYDVIEGVNSESGKNEYFQVSRVNPNEKISLGIEVPATAATLKTEAARNAKMESEAGSMKATLKTVGKILSSDGLSGFSGLDSFRRFVPGTEAANVNAWIEQLQSQNFLTAVEQMKGMGALSENEGKKISGAVAAISPSMSDEAIKSELQKIEADLLTGLDRIETDNLLDINGVSSKTATSTGSVNWSDM